MTRQETLIGSSLSQSRRRAVFGLLIMVIAIAADLWLSWKYGRASERRWLAIIAAGLMWWACGGDRASLGLRLTPLQPVRRWVAMTFWVGMGMLAFFAVVSLVAWALIIVPELPRMSPQAAIKNLPFACIEAPLQEETMYRLVLSVPLVCLIEPRMTILASGVVFALLHVVYGNPGMDNAIAGFVLGWAFLKSGSLTVPILLHSLGNLFVTAVHVFSWWFG